MTCTGTTHTASAYGHGLCRCPVGREAHRVYVKPYHQGPNPPTLVDATGTRRRAQGLLAMGHTGQAIADAGGIPAASRVSQICTTRIRVTVATEAAMRRACARLGTHAGPSVRTRRRAERAGYVSLWAWDDIDDPAAKPRGVSRKTRTGRLDLVGGAR